MISANARRRALGACAAAAAAGGAAVGASGGADGSGDSAARDSAGRRAVGLPAQARARGARRAAALSPSRAAGQLVILRFRGATAPAYVLRALRRGWASGVILFADNVRSRAQLRGLTASLHRAAGGSAIVAVDQEGGAVRRVPWSAPVAGQPRQAASGTVRASALAGARTLRQEGVTVAFAPVADVPSVSGAALAARAFARRPAAVAGHVARAVHGWRDGGVAPTLKHFPGLGGARRNTDDAPATIRRSREQILREDLAPFRAGIAAGAPLVMVGHALYPALDPDHIASQSRAIIDDLLRERLGFTGVVVTDSLEAHAVTARSSVPAAAVRSIAAGADLALTTGRGSFLSVLRALRARARADRGFATRVRAAAGRVLALRAAAAR